MASIYGKGGMLVSAIYYDERGNVVQQHSQNHQGGYEHFYYHFTFTGKPLKIRHIHSIADTIITDIVRYTYDTMERQLTISYDHNGAGAVLLSSNAYDRLGRLASCTVNDGGCNISYDYNVRGWMKGVTASVGAATIFGQTLYYEEVPVGGTPCWGGNISAISWRERESIKAATPTQSQYLFSYDALDRLTRADYSSDGEQWNGDLVTQGDRDFSCAYTYDLNGNMLSLKRYGVNFYNTAMPTHIRSYGLIDDLTLSYRGNQLLSVTDKAEDPSYAGAMDFRDGADSKEEYTYDANGNMTSDRNKGITRITYNPLNLPESILFADGHEILYTYAADGRKLREEYRLNNFAIIDADQATSTQALDEAVVPPGIGDLPAEPAYTTLTVRDYCGNYVYCNGKLERILTDNGYIQDGEHYFYVKDYQGNVRAVLDQQNQPVELTSYYPYGTPMAATTAESTQPYKYGAKELNRQNGLNWYDSNARYYDSPLGRTHTMDPKAESYPHLTPYLWCAANPLAFTDPSGKYLKGIDGSPVIFDKNRGWSSNVTSSIAKIGGAMMKTQQGWEILSKMMNSTYPIILSINSTATTNEDGNIVAGETHVNYTEEDNTNNKDFKEVVIIIYEKVIKEYMHNDIFYKDSGFSTSDIIGTVATHEGAHGTDKKANSGFVSSEEAEAKAINVEKKAISELKKRDNK